MHVHMYMYMYIYIYIHIYVYIYIHIDVYLFGPPVPLHLSPLSFPALARPLSHAVRSMVVLHFFFFGIVHALARCLSLTVSQYLSFSLAFWCSARALCLSAALPHTRWFSFLLSLNQSRTHPLNHQRNYLHASPSPSSLMQFEFTLLSNLSISFQRIVSASVKIVLTVEIFLSVVLSIPCNICVSLSHTPTHTHLHIGIIVSLVCVLTYSKRVVRWVAMPDTLLTASYNVWHLSHSIIQ